MVEVSFFRYIFSFIFSFLMAFYLTPMMIKAAYMFNILDIPGGIKKHSQPTPYLGGIAIYIAFIATLAIAYPFENQILWLLLGVTFLLFIGLVDDLHILKPMQKLLGQFIAVLCFLKGGFSLKTNFFSDFFNLGMSAFWMLAIINAFNLVDVMDGLASVLAIVIAFSFLIIALWLKQYAICLLLLAFIAPLIAFLFYNKPPAKIYLGDAGSLFVGGFLAAIPLLLPWSTIFHDAYYAPIIILGVPLLEVASLVVIRTSLGLAFYRGSPHHYSIYLRKKGWSVGRVLIFSALMSSILSLIAILFLFGFIKIWMLFVLGCIFLLSWCYFIFY